MGEGKPNPLPQLQLLTEVLDEALQLFDSKEPGAALPTPVDAIQSSLFEQCIELCRQGFEGGAEPIRTVHHLSCTGGTLIVKCLAAMPNVLVLNEIDPLSTIQFNPEKPRFAPTDIFSLLRQGDQNVSDGLLEQLFLQNLDLLRNELGMVGKRLLLRDHSHSHFLTGNEIATRSSFLSLVKSRFPTRSIVTVRNPIDSFLSVQNHGWEHFNPKTFEEYCRRYHAFLDAYEGVPVFRYEDFVNEPSVVMAEMCRDLELNFSESFVDTFDVFKFSGDSGRSGGTIQSRPRRKVGNDFIENANRSDVFVKLMSRLGYETTSGT